MFWSPSGGVRRVLSTKHAWFTRHGWRHTVLAPGAAGAGHVDCGGLRLPATGGYRLPLNHGRAERLIEAAGPDLVEAADPYTLAWAVRSATARLGVPAVAFCHSDLPALAASLLGGPASNTGRWAARQAQRYLAALYGGFDLVLAPSLALAQRLQAAGLRQVQVQPLGVDDRTFNPAARDLAWRRRWCLRQGLAADTRLLVYSGRYAPEKNLPVLAAAVRLLGPGHLLLAVGAGPCPPQGPQVRALPPLTDGPALARLLASADVYVHAGDQETFGLGVLEAMACGTPVVVSASGGLGELALGAGVCVPGGRPADWAAAMRASLDPATRHAPRTLAALARARAHTWDRVLGQLAQRYLMLLRRVPAEPARQAWPISCPAAVASHHPP